ncbi:MAG: efflux RND transporter periplasmic adaptor subunit [Alphaproteobacteria bacterium]|nr:efflux RND transporter periplasmic adaptor subunit [Alphaproteobacteria bacterium]
MALPPGEFQPAAEQWTNLQFTKARQAPFGPAIITDGQIATDDDHTTQLFSPFTGRISRIFVSPGDVVRKGQPIYAVAASEVVQGRSDIDSAEANLASARKALAVAQANADRQQKLFAIQGSAARDVEQAQSDLAAARSNATGAEAQVTAAQGRVALLGLDAGKVAAGRRNEAIVRSPIDGTVTARQAGVGQYVESAASGANSPLFTISDLSHVWLVANVREADAGALKRGVMLRIEVPAYPDRSFDGRVFFVSPSVDPNTRRIAVRARIANRDGALRPNMFASAQLSNGELLEVIEVPTQAVLFEGDDAHVWIAHPERRSLSLRPIRVSNSQRGSAIVTQGLSAGETVVTSGSVFIDRANDAS